MKARAAAARTRKKKAGTGSTKAAVKRLTDKSRKKQQARSNLRQDIEPEIRGKDMSRKKTRTVRRPGGSTQSQTHRRPRVSPPSPKP